MLVLSRKIGEKIYIGDDIILEVVEFDRGKVRIGILAPKEIPIFRKELLTEDNQLIKERKIKNEDQLIKDQGKEKQSLIQ